MKKFFLSFFRYLLKPQKKYLPPKENLVTYIGDRAKVLIVRQHNQLGDMLLSNSLFRAIKQKLPNSFTTFDCE